jgi:hypothetical protein
LRASRIMQRWAPSLSSAIDERSCWLACSIMPET